MQHKPARKPKLVSVTQFPVSQPIPQHIAIIMDGNRRWAKQFGMPAALGHANGARRVRSIVQACADRGVRFITLFAFSTENWQRPPDEVSSLMGLLALYLRKEVSDMNAKGVRLKVVGDTSDFDVKIQALIRDAQEKTAHNDTITLTIAANYGGRWDVVQAVKSWQAAHPGEPVDAMDEASLAAHLGLAYAPDPDLLIRTGGESRISNFMLWQLAYTEMFFTDVLWPSFTADELDQAIAWYGMRDRRFGGTSTLSVVKA
ncbi:MAG TPA: di-trans,poly-cis-decaprenylcistransferase [Polaromonas sp.]|uniref:polyprenyl diphosphate synthase n=1 Tax=Polaromonas sp. UBA4122 TaxID=1947074 RepID=UPI000ED24909|nr:di-trans,poly-cis-decaprenylcistransferase [Polaromonas sp.]